MLGEGLQGAIYVPDLKFVDGSTSPSPMLRATTSTEATAAADIPLFRSKQPAVRIEHAAKIGEADTGELFQNTLDSRFRLESALTLDFGHTVLMLSFAARREALPLSGLYPFRPHRRIRLIG